jgi:Lrp/AsnC ligand binding domain
MRVALAGRAVAEQHERYLVLLLEPRGVREADGVQGVGRERGALRRDPVLVGVVAAVPVTAQQGEGLLGGHAPSEDGDRVAVGGEQPVPGRYGYALSAYVYLDIAQRSWKSVRGQLLSMSEVDHVALVSGEHDILLRVRARDAVSLRDVVLTRLQDIPEVRSTQTVLTFEEATPAQAPR